MNSETLVALAEPRPRVALRPSGFFSWTRAIALALVVTVALGVWALRLRGPIDLRFDGAVYYELGSSLAQGNGYRIASEPGAPEGVQYPPLLPLLVAAPERTLGTTDPQVVAPVLRRTYFVLFLAFAISAFAVASMYLPPWPAMAATLLCLLQTNTYLYSDLLFTELPFALACLAFVWALNSPRFANAPRVRESLAFALASAAFLLRAAGIAVLVTWVGEALLRRRWRLTLLRVALAGVPFLAWQAHVARVRSSRDYRQPAYAYQRASYQYYNVTYAENMSLADPFRPELGRATLKTYITRGAANLASLPAGVGESVSESIGFWRAAVRGPRESEAEPWTNRVTRFPLYFLTSLVASGVMLLIRRRNWSIVLLIASSMALVCTSPWPQQFARYLTPLIPFLTIALVLGTLRLAEFLSGQPGLIAQRGRWALAGFGTIVLALQIQAGTKVFRERRYEKATHVDGERFDAPRLFYFNKAWLNWDQALRWIEQRAAKDDIVVTTSPQLCHLETGLRAVMPPMEQDPAEARRLIDSVPGRWLIVDELSFLDSARVYGLPAVQGDPAAWQLVHQIGRTFVYRRAVAANAAGSRQT